MPREKGTPVLVNQREVFSRVAELAGATQDTEVAAALDVSAQVFANWKARGTVPFEKLCAFAMERQVSLDWLIFGRGYSAHAQGIDTQLLIEALKCLSDGIQRMGEPTSSSFVVKEAAVLYAAAAQAREPAERIAIVRREAHRTLATYARAKAALLTRGKASAQARSEAASLEAFASELEASRLKGASNPAEHPPRG